MVRLPSLLIVLSLTTVFTMGFVEQAHARRGRSSYNNAAAAKARKQAAIKAAQQQYAAAEQALQMANSSGSAATAQLQQVIGLMTQSANGMREAMSDVKDLGKDLRETEEDILREQSADSPYVTAVQELATIKSAMAAIEKRLLGASDYIAERDRVRLKGGAAAVGQLRESTLGQDREYSELKLKLTKVSDEMHRVRTELFSADNEWKSIQQHLSQAQHEANARSAEVYAHAPDRADPIAQIKDAKQAAAYAAAVKAQAAAALQSLGSSPTTKTSSAGKK